MGEMPRFDLLSSPLAGTSLIEASAGTGKTYTITGLVLRFILEADVPVDQILVVTFTEAATSELKDRIRRRLREASETFEGIREPDTSLSEMLSRQSDRLTALRKLNAAISDFDQASVFTIHAFCLRTLMDHAFASGILFDAELVTDQENLLREVVQDFWRKHFYRASPLFFSHAAASGMNLQGLRALLTKNVFNPHLRIIPPATLPDCSALELEFRSEFEKLSELWRKERDAVEAILAGSPALNRARVRAERVPGWVREMDAYLSGECMSCASTDSFERFRWRTLQGALRKGQVLTPNPFFHGCDRLEESRVRLQAAYDARLLALKVELLHHVRRELAKRKISRNILFFDDLLVKLERALAGPGGGYLAGMIRGRFRTALIDEFQDTDSLQYAIFSRVFGGGDSPLFLIGDPKQAIYGFRGADIFTYLDASREASWRFTLGENWRSQPDLIHAVNTVFSNTDSPFVYEEIGFQPVRHPERKAHERLTIDGVNPPPLRIWFLEASRVTEKDVIDKGVAREYITEAVAAEISRLLALARENRALIGERPLQEKDIAVLVRTNLEARRIKEVLSNLGVHAVLYDIGNLFETEEAAEVERVLAAVANPGDAGCLRIALATEMMGVCGEELDRLMTDERGWEDWLVAFGEYHELWVRHGFFRMFRFLLSREEVLPRLMSLSDGERRCTNILHLAEVLHRRTIEGNTQLFSLVKWLANQRDPATPRLDEHQLRLESDENAVKLVTIHKSKGLEYPVVFCPFTWSGSRLKDKDAPFVFHDTSNGGELVLDLGSPEREKHRVLCEKEQLAENLRLLYVAVTRAKHHCTLVWGRFKDAGSSAPAFLLHPSIACGWDGSLNSLEQVYRAMDDDAIWKDLELLRDRSGGSIDLSPMPLDEGVPLARPEKDAPELQHLEFSGRIVRRWSITSFSSLILDQPHRGESADWDEGVEIDSTDEADGLGHATGDESLDMFSFPRGPASGILLHSLFEHLDFASRDEAEARELISRKIQEHGFDAKWTEPVSWMVRNVLDVPLPSESGTFCLSQVPLERRLSELEFVFPVGQVTGGELKEAFTACVGGGRETGRDPYLSHLRLETVQGFMKGFIDLVFQVDGKFFILDWKSNYLGCRLEDYGQEILERAMNENFYKLQYTLYTVALHQYLQVRVPAYHYEEHFGGVYYVFLRGVDSTRGPQFGIYRDRPSRESIEALSALLRGKERGNVHDAGS